MSKICVLDFSMEVNAYTCIVCDVSSIVIDNFDSFGCKKDCFSLFDDDAKIDIIAHLNSFSDKNQQDIFLQGLSEVQDVKSRRLRKEDPKLRMFLAYII